MFSYLSLIFICFYEQIFNRNLYVDKYKAIPNDSWPNQDILPLSLRQKIKLKTNIGSAEIELKNVGIDAVFSRVKYIDLGLVYPEFKDHRTG